MATFSFDIVSEYNVAEMNNVFDQAAREIASRYDFKGTHAELEWLDGDKTGLKVTGDSDWQIDAILDIVRKNWPAANSRKNTRYIQRFNHHQPKTTKEVLFKQGLDQDKAKKLPA